VTELLHMESVNMYSFLYKGQAKEKGLLLFISLHSFLWD